MTMQDRFGTDHYRIAITGTPQEHEEFGWDERIDPATFEIPDDPVEFIGGTAWIQQDDEGRVWADIVFDGDVPMLGDWQRLIVDPIRDLIKAR